MRDAESCPQGERLVKAPEGAENDVGANYYSTSIRDGAHRYQSPNKRQRLSDLGYPDQNQNSAYTGPVVPSSQWTLRSNDPYIHTCQTQALNFNMRIVSPGEERRTIDKAFHVYTQLQGDQAGGAPTPLEDVHNWRYCFPRLTEIIENNDLQPPDCDIILLEASLHLMDSYPPKGSKLGIDLDLEYANPMTRAVSLPGGLKKAFCNTHFYDRDGRVECKQSDLPNIDNQSRVRAVFESGWWAKLLGKLTELRLAAAHESRDRAVSADEEVREYFRNLTAVQEVYGSSTSADGRRDSSSGYGYRADQHVTTGDRRIAILLWKFRQTRPGEVGTTTWRKLLPPPSRESVKSPGPLLDTLSGAPLHMDALLLSSQHQSVSENPFHDVSVRTHARSQHGNLGHPERLYASQTSTNHSLQQADMSASQWPEYPVISDNGMEPEIISPLGLPSYDVLMAMGQHKDNIQNSEHAHPPSLDSNHGLVGGFEAAIASLNGISEAGVDHLAPRPAAEHWAPGQQYPESILGSNAIHVSSRPADDPRRLHDHRSFHRLDQETSLQRPHSSLDSLRRHATTPQEHLGPRLRTPFEDNQSQTQIYQGQATRPYEGGRTNSLAFPPRHQAAIAQVEVDDHLQAFLDAAAELGTFDDESELARPNNMGYRGEQNSKLHSSVSNHHQLSAHQVQARTTWGSPTNMQSPANFDIHFSNAHGPSRLYRAQSQSSQQLQPPSRPQSATVPMSDSTHTHQQQARLASGKANSRPLTPSAAARQLRPQTQMPFSTESRRSHDFASTGIGPTPPNDYGHPHSGSRLQQSHGSQSNNLHDPRLERLTTPTRTRSPGTGGELVDRLVNQVRAGVEGGHVVDEHVVRGHNFKVELDDSWNGESGGVAEEGGCVDNCGQGISDLNSHETGHLNHRQRFDPGAPMVEQVGMD